MRLCLFPLFLSYFFLFIMIYRLGLFHIRVYKMRRSSQINVHKICSSIADWINIWIKVSLLLILWKYSGNASLEETIWLPVTNRNTVPIHFSQGHSHHHNSEMKIVANHVSVPCFRRMNVPDLLCILSSKDNWWITPFYSVSVKIVNLLH